MAEVTKYSPTATLRKEAEERGIEGYDKMEREELKEILLSDEQSEEETSAEANPEVQVKEETDEKDSDQTKEKEDSASDKEKGSSVDIAIPGVAEGPYPKGSKAEQMKAHLAGQPKVTILIPLEGKEKPGTTFPVTLNGYRLNIRKGTYVQVPKQVADVVMESQKQTRQAILEHPLRIKADSKKAQILSK